MEEMDGAICNVPNNKVSTKLLNKTHKWQKKITTDRGWKSFHGTGNISDGT